VLNDGAWHLIVAVRDNDADMNRVFVDGAKVDSASHDYTAGFAGAVQVNIGYLNLSGHYRFEGAVDEVAFIHRALTDGEILSIYNDGLLGFGYCGTEAVPPAIISTPTTNGRPGELYVYDVDAVGAPNPTYQLIVNPAGMMIDPTSGVIEWTPAAAGSEPVTVRAISSSGTDDQSFTIDVSVPPDCPADMISYWKLDEAAGPPYEDYYAGNDATCAGCPTPTAGIVNGAQDFDGIDDEVDAPNNGSWDWSQDDSFSIAYWMKTSASTAGNRVIVGRDDAINSLHWWVGCDNSGRVRFQLRDTNGNGAYIGDKGILLNDGLWHFIVAVRDNSVDMNRIYVDGAKVDSAFYDYTAGFGGTADLNIGYINLGGHYRFEGVVDEVATFDRALADVEILAQYNNGLAGNGYCTFTPLAPTITSIPVVEATVGQLYTYDVDAYGLPVPTYELTASPAGMTIDPISGVIEWTPTAAGTEPVTVEASNSVGTDDQSFSIVVSEPPLCPGGMISYWKLEETSGSFYDDHFDGNDGQSAVSPPSPVSGIVGGAQDFNGTSDRITVPDDPSLDWASDQSFTIELWARFTNVASRNKVMIGRDDGGGGHPHWWLGALQSSGIANFNLLDTNANGVALTGAAALNDDLWHHVVAVRDNGADMNRLYVDGVKVDSAYHDYTAGFEAATAIGIGFMAYAGTPDYFYDGSLDEIALYSRALSDDEIQQHYTAGMNGIGYCTDTPVATLLQSYSTRTAGSNIMVEWELSEAGLDMRFAVSRADGKTGRFIEIVNAKIDQSNLTFSFEDQEIEPGMTYRYRVAVTDEAGRHVLFETGAVSAPAAELTLMQNRPNPFNPSTTIRFVLPGNGHANLSIFDARGKFVVNLVDGVLGAGLREFTWDGTNARGEPASSGVYFYRLEAGNTALTRKMVLIK
jgi:hypothetical protein